MTSIQHTAGGNATALALAALGMPIVCGRLDSSGNPDGTDARWRGWQKTVAGSRSVRAARSWRRGEALAGVTGVVYDVLDIDPRNGGKESIDRLSASLGEDGPEIYWKVRTPRGGLHLYIACLGIGSHNGFLPGLDLKGGNADGSGRGFVFLPGTFRFGNEYSVSLSSSVSGGLACRDLREFVQKCLDTSASSSVSSGRKSEESLRAAVLSAAEGEQRLALLRYVHELERMGVSASDIVARVRALLRSVENFDSSDPWYPARGRNPDRHVLSLLHRPGAVVGDGTAEELAGIVGPIRPAVEEESFWESRPELQHVLRWARSRRAGPWAVLGEVLAQAICHTSPAFVLPALVGGHGTLNMLIAVTGASGAGKSAARACAAAAFDWKGDGFEIPDAIPCFPLGSGEGLVRNFGYMHKDSSGTLLVRTCLSCVISIDEIDTFLSLSGRSGSTIAPQLRQLYSGEALGFGYADMAKRVVIPAGSYRAAVIAGVQPGRGAVILGDTESGFAQRWLWLPVGDPCAPDSRPVAVTRGWSIPEAACDAELLEDGSGFVVMDVCSSARADIEKCRLEGLRSGRGDIKAHSLYTRLKVAGGLALLGERDSVSSEDWELSGVVQAVSDSCREGVARRLSEVARAENISRGRAEGVRNAVARRATEGYEVSRVCEAILRHVPSSDWISENRLKHKVALRDREAVGEALSLLVSSGKVVMEEVVYRGRTGAQYRRI